MAPYRFLFQWIFALALFQGRHASADAVEAVDAMETVVGGGDRRLDAFGDAFKAVVGVIKHAAEEEGKEHEKPPQRDVGIACMLLGSVAFVMMLFYVVNWRDDDIRLYAWTIISTTTCLFTAVLSFSGVKVLSDMYLKVPAGMSGIACARGYMIFLLAFSTLQFACKFISGAYCDCCCPIDNGKESWVVADSLRADHGDEVNTNKVRTKTANRSIAWIDGVEVFVEKRRLNYERTSMNVRAWSQLLAHLSGFAALEAGGALQHMDWFRESPFRAFLAVIINQVSIGALFRAMDMFRTYTIYDEEDERVVMLGESIEEAEIDVISLASSFLTVQVLRFALSGTLPDMEGKIEPYTPSGMFAIGMLILCGFITLVLSLALTFLPTISTLLTWLIQKTQNIMGLVFAWSCLWGVHMFVRETSIFTIVFDTTLYPNERRLIAALMLSVCCLAAIRLLDLIQDSGASFPRILQNMINVFSVLIGLSWEMCFEGGVEELSEETKHPEAMKLVFTVCAVAVVLPAWRMFIVRRVMDLERKATERQEARKKIERGEDPEYMALHPRGEHPSELELKQDKSPKGYRSSGCF